MPQKNYQKIQENRKKNYENNLKVLLLLPARQFIASLQFYLIESLTAKSTFH